MKKLCALLLCVLLVSVVAFSAFAAGETTVKVTTSATEVKRGDVVDVTVSLAGENAWSSFGYIPYIPSEYFTIPADGTVVIPGAGLSEFTAAGGGVVMLNSASAASGEVFKFTIKISDNAPFGEFKISDPTAVMLNNGSAAVACVVDEVTLTVVCDHNFGAWANKDAEKHERTCSICGAPETEAHAWDNGTVTTNPSCFEKGEKTFACTCGATKTEPVEATGEHVYGAWTQKDAEKHTRACTTTGCTATEEAAHAWDNGTETLKPSCVAKGEMTFTCECAATKTEPIDEIPHELENLVVSGDKHSGHCTKCDQDVEEEHEYTEAKFDAEKHWEECLCGEKQNEAEHAFGTALNSDENGHWYACACGAKKDEAAHTLTYKVEGDKHFQVCECGFETAKAAHEYAADGKCACGAEKPAEPTQPTEPKPTEPKPTEPKPTEPKDPVKDPAQPDGGDMSFATLLVVLMVLSACGMAVTVIARKKIVR